MKLSWNGLKISIAGARLSHLAQKDKIWDYGSMIEEVKMVFMQIERARKKDQSELLRKYMTLKGYEFFQGTIGSTENKKTENVLETVSIIEVKVHNKQLPDRFCALVKGTKNEWSSTIDLAGSYKTAERFSERWLFLRQGDWWLLDSIKSLHLIF